MVSVVRTTAYNGRNLCKLEKGKGSKMIITSDVICRGPLNLTRKFPKLGCFS